MLYELKTYNIILIIYIILMLYTILYLQINKLLIPITMAALRNLATALGLAKPSHARLLASGH